MSATEPLYSLVGINLQKFTRQEILFLEAILFKLMYEEVKEFFRTQYKQYFRLMKFNIKKENEMLEANFTRFILKDILSTEDYSLQGIARYTNTHEDVVQEVIDGRNLNPSARFLRKIIELHHCIRRDLYNQIMKKISTNIQK